VYGFGLIAVALILALVYGMLCRPEPVEDASNSTAATTQGDAQ